MKDNLELQSRLGWNGDPCIPQVHAWCGVNCEFEPTVGAWFINGLGFDYQGIRGQLGDSVAALQHLQSLDLSHNRLIGSIPASLSKLSKLQELLLNDNQLTGEVPSSLGAFPIRGGVLNLANNDGLCGLGLRSCNKMSHGVRMAIAMEVIRCFIILLLGGALNNITPKDKDGALNNAGLHLADGIGGASEVCVSIAVGNGNWA